MQATANKLEGSRVRLEVEVGTDDLKKEYTRAIRRVSGRVSIPGFRRGKAPRHIVEGFVGADTVLREMVEHVVPRAYADAVEQTGVAPIPSRKRPPEISSMVAASMAVKAGWRAKALTTPVPSSVRSVTAATAARAEKAER